MRRLVLLLLPVLVLVACGESSRRSTTPTQLAADPAATPTLPPPPSPTASHDQFYSVDFISPEVGWAAGAQGIFATKDGGAHWVQQYSGVGDAYTGQVDFLDASTGIALSYRGLMSTRDGGLHWAEMSSDGENNPEHVDFVSPLTGWAIAATERGAPAKSLLRTDDGGETYSIAESPADSVCFGDEHHGWYAGASGVMHTVDGGATWAVSLEKPLPNWGEGHTWNLPIFKCAGRDVAWVLFTGGVATGHEAYAVFRTIDGGASWSPVVQGPLGPALGTHVGGDYPGPIAVLDSKDVWVMGICPMCSGEGTTWIEATHDGGLTWASLATPPGAGPFPQDLQFVGQEHGWLATTNGIFATTDGGRTWVKQR